MDNRNAFTLIELSVVIVIIGLIVAGIVAGQSLVKQAKLRSLASDLSKFELAFNTFHMQYDALPGDFDNAYAYWGSSCATGGSAQDNCNGNGNGLIEAAGMPDAAENNRAWQHLALANMIEGSFSGTGSDFIPGGNNTPTIFSSEVGVAIWHGTGSDARLYNSTSNLLEIGTRTGASVWPYGPFISPADLSVFDTKFDDGEADSGKIFSNNGYGIPNNGCVGGTNANPAAPYQISSDQKLCHIEYVISKRRN